MLNNAQRWFLVIVLGGAVAFLIVATSITFFPVGGYRTPQEEASDTYQDCVRHASYNLSGENQQQALNDCKNVINDIYKTNL